MQPKVRAGQEEWEVFTRVQTALPFGLQWEADKEPEKDRKPTLTTNLFVRFLDEKMLMTASVWGQVGKVIKEVNAIFFAKFLFFVLKI